MRVSRRLHRIEQGRLQQQVLDGIGRDAEFREHGEDRSRPMAFLGERQNSIGIALRVGRMAPPGTGRHTGETVTIEGLEGGSSCRFGQGAGGL